MTSKFEDYLDKIREELEEESKGISSKESVHLVNESGHKIVEEYGITVLKTSDIDLRYEKCS